MTVATQPLAAKWFEPDDRDPENERNRASALLNETAGIETRQSSWHDLNLWNAVLYTNRRLPGLLWGAIHADNEMFPANLRTENLVEEIGSALLSKASSSPVKPTPVPHGRSYKVERAVRQLDRFMTATWRHIAAEDAAVEAFLDAFIAGIGCVRIGYDEDSETLCAESVFFDNIVIDNRESNNRQAPRHYRIRQCLPRSTVEARYPDFALEEQRRYVDHRDVAADWVIIVEAWRLPDSKGNGGRHTIACCGQLLIDEEWTYDWVPLHFFKWEDNVSGFFGRSGVETLVPFQIIMNELNEDIRAGQEVAARPRMLYHHGANIDFSQWDSEVGRMLGWSGTPGMEPKPLIWPSNMQELYAERDRVRQAAHMYMGLSTFTSQAEMPPGFRADSSMGVREFRNMEDARHLRRWTRFENFRLDIAKGIMNVLATCKGAESYSVTYQRSGGSRAPSYDIPYKEIKLLTKDHYSWTMDATPFSMTSPAASREIVRDWSSRGLMDSAEAKRTRGVPNLSRIDDLEMASYDDILRHLDIMEEGKYENPTELTNLVYGIPRVTQNLHRLRWYEGENAEETALLKKIIANHHRWILTGLAIQAAATQQQAMYGQQGPAAFAPMQGMPGTNATTSPMGGGM